MNFVSARHRQACRRFVRCWGAVEVRGRPSNIFQPSCLNSVSVLGRGHEHVYICAWPVARWAQMLESSGLTRWLSGAEHERWSPLRGLRVRILELILTHTHQSYSTLFHRLTVEDTLSGGCDEWTLRYFSLWQDPSARKRELCIVGISQICTDV